MKRVLLAVGMAVALLVIPGEAARVVRADPNGNAQYNFAVGGGTALNIHQTQGSIDSGVQEIHFAFSAHCQTGGPIICTSDPSVVAPAPTGHAVLTFIYPDHTVKYSGAVTCLDVTDPQNAAISFVDSKTGMPIGFTVTNGTATTGVADLLFANDTIANSSVCDQATDELGPGGFVTKGNIIVNQGALLPCVGTTDNTTYMIDNSCNLYTMSSSGWQLVQ